MDITSHLAVERARPGRSAVDGMRARDLRSTRRARGVDRRCRRLDDEHESAAAAAPAAGAGVLFADITDPFPTWNQTNPRNAEYQGHLAEGFRKWRLPIDGLVARPLSLSLDEIGACRRARRLRRTSANRASRRSASGQGRPCSACSRRREGSCRAPATSSSTHGTGGTRHTTCSKSNIPRRSLPTGSTGVTSGAATARRCACGSSGGAGPDPSSCVQFTSSTRWRASAGYRWNQLGFRVPLVRRRVG